ncbi:MAG: sulfotransferase [Cyclobacteriaceae bacterium]|nr:sulfotransferase [Cyclobacteriaceae bacterium]
MNDTLLRFVMVVAPYQRSGTNFLGRLMLQHPDITRPIGAWEIPFMELDDQLRKIRTAFRTTLPGRHTYEMSDFRYAFGSGFANVLRNRVPCEEKERAVMLIKHVSPRGVEHFFEMIPDGKLIFLVRDGRDTVTSLLAAHFRERRGRFFRPDLAYRYAKRWRQNTMILKRAKEKFLDRALIVRYEDLVADEFTQLRRIGDYIGLFFDQQTLDLAKNLPVKGSSFAPKDGVRSVWRDREKTSDFKPVGRWKSLSKLETFFCVSQIKEPMSYFYPEIDLSS